jgi:hypothetical protein
LSIMFNVKKCALYPIKYNMPIACQEFVFG